MDKQEALEYEEITMPDGRPGVRVTGFAPSITDMAQEEMMGRKSNAQKALEAEQRKVQHEQERNTHFANYAEMQIKQMHALHNVFIKIPDFTDGHETLQTFLAQCAYDLIQHAFQSAEVPFEGPVSDFYSPEDVPDMAAWSEQSE
jgi:hypothetical protein